MTEAWRVVSWPPVLWQAEAAARLEMVHLGTQVVNLGDEEEACTGHTIWGASASNGTAGMAWDWVQIPQGVVALADPFALITNLWLLGADGQVLSPVQAARHLNGLVHALPWQLEVQRALDEQWATH